MSTSITNIGRCPECEHKIDQYDVLISYELEGETRYYAECPGCEKVVRPVE